MTKKDEQSRTKTRESYSGLAFLLTILGAALPIIVSPWGYQAFTPIRQWVLTSVAGLGILFLLSYWLKRKRLGVALAGLEIQWVLFLLILGLSTIFSMNYSASIWGSFFFREGLIIWIVYFVIFYLSVQSFATEKSGDRLVRALKYASVFVGAYGILQFARLDPLKSLVPSFEGKASSFLGNPAYLGGSLALVAPIFLCLALNPEAPSSKRRSNGCVFLFLLIASVLTASRAAWIALALAIALALTYYLANKGNTIPKSFLKAFGSVLLVVAIAFGLALGVSGEFRQKTYATAVGIPTSLEIRTMTWRRSLAMIVGKPIIGHGLGTYEIAFPGYIDQAWEENIGHESLPDDPHNLLLNIAASSGIVGLAAFVWLMVALFIRVFRKLFRADKSKRYLVGGILLGGIAYLVNLMFHPSTIEVTALFWILMGCVLGLPTSAKKGKKGKEKMEDEQKRGRRTGVITVDLDRKGTVLVWCGFIVALAAFIASTAFFLKPVVADAFLKSAFEKWSSGDASAAIEDAQHAVSWDRRYGFARLVEGRMLYNRACMERSEPLFKEAEGKLITLVEDCPDWEVAAYTLGLFYLTDFEAYPNRDDNPKRELREKATALFEEILERDPYYLDAQAKLARFELFADKYDQALERLEKVIESRPDWPEPYIIAGQCYLWKGEGEKADWYFEKADELSKPDPANSG